jgi:hypothetical protein
MSLPAPGPDFLSTVNADLHVQAWICSCFCVVVSVLGWKESKKEIMKERQTKRKTGRKKERKITRERKK